MKERPILFSAPMVRAILAGTKTQTRRVMARQKQHDFTDYTLFGQQGHPDDEAERRGGWAQPWKAIEHAPDWPDGKEEQCLCPYAQARGDRLWVRETTRMRYLENILTGEPTKAECGEYVADGEPVLDPAEFDLAWWYSRKTCPAIHMPRWASRIVLEVVDVRIERLHDISEADAKAEGCEQSDDPDEDAYVALPSYRQGYRKLWETINGVGSWAANPWVWVVVFRRVEP